VPLAGVLSQSLERQTGVDVPVEAWDLAGLPAHLHMNFRVLDDKGAELAQGRDLPALRLQLGVKARRQFTENARSSFERQGVTAWDFGELPEQVEFTRAGQKLLGFPAIVDEGKSVSLVLLDTEDEAAAATRRGLRRLFQFAAVEQVKFIGRNLRGLQDMALKWTALAELQGERPQDKAGTMERLQEALVTAACDRAFFAEDDRIRDRAAFEARVVKARTRLVEVANEVCSVVQAVLSEVYVLRPRVNQPGAQAWQKLMGDVKAQIRALLAPDFITATPYERLKQMPRYLQAIGVRLDKFPSNPARDAQWQDTLAQWWKLLQQRREEFRWMLEELRVSLWAQQLRTPYPVSFKRLEKAWSEL
jgi:ATP-dependent helicase HrpA